MMRGQWCALGAFIIVALVISLASTPAPAAAVEYGSITIAGDQKPALHLEFRGKELRMAPTLEGLASAQPVKATKVNSYNMGPGQVMASYQFPEVGLPLSMKGVSRIRAVISLDRTVRTLSRNAPREQEPMGSGFGMQCRVTKPGAGGADWTYMFYARGSAGAQDDTGANTATIPVFDSLKLTIETKIEGKKARIGLRAVATGRERIKEQIYLQEVQKNGKPAPATLEVADKDGKVVHTQKGDLKKFGFT